MLSYLTSIGLCTHTVVHADRLFELTKGMGCALPMLHGAVCVAGLNAMTLKFSVIYRQRHTPEQLACLPNATSLSFRRPQNNAVLQVKTSANAGMPTLMDLGADMDLERGEQCKGVKRELCQEKNTSLNFCVTNMVISKFAKKMLRKCLTSKIRLKVAC